jgi:hypothetical protein
MANPRSTRSTRLIPLIAVLGAAVLTAAPAKQGDTPPPSPEAAALPNGIESSICRLLRELRTRGLLPAENARLRRMLLDSVLAAFDTGGRVVEARSQTSPIGMIAGTRPLNGASLYIRVAAVEDGFTGAVEKAIGALPQEDGGGVLVDLRGARGNALKEAAVTAALMGTRKLPVVVLVDRRTQAASEVLADALRRDCDAVLVGQPTRGLPYPLRPVVLADDLEVMLPEMAVGDPAEPVKPDVLLDQDKTPIGPDRGGPPRDTTVGIAGDECMRKATDLLTAICTFRQKHF